MSLSPASRCLVVVLCWLLPPLSQLCAQPAEPAKELLQAVYLGDTARWQELLASGANPNVADAAGNTPLHFAAMNHDSAAVVALLAAKAQVSAKNSAGVAPIIYGAGDAAVVRALLDQGANPNTMSKAKITPLLVAVAQDGAHPAVQLLLAAGANTHGDKLKTRKSLLSEAIFGGDRKSIELILASGAEFAPQRGMAPLTAAAWVNDLETLRTLLARGVNPNHDSGLAGHALNFALYGQHREAAALLIEQGADLNFRSPMGHGTPPIIWAAYNQDGNAELVQRLVHAGVDPNSTNDIGATALDYALRTGKDTALVRYLRSIHATAAPPLPSDRRARPDRPLPPPETRQNVIRQRVQTSLDLLQRSSTAFLKSPVVLTQAKCISCHQQNLPTVAAEFGRARGFRVNDIELGRQLHAQMEMWRATAENARQMGRPVSDPPPSLGYGFFALRSSRFEPDATTDAMARYLIRAQRREGWWVSVDSRPPLEDGPIVATAWAARIVRSQSPLGMRTEAADAVKRARDWLEKQAPQTQNDMVFQLLGLHWTDTPVAALATRAATLASQQRPDGGWAQLPSLESDAWATGTALFALHRAGGLATSDPIYQRGIDFLLRTQAEDGSWWVRSRAWPFQPHFDGQFPYGKDQWISASATAWATIALLMTFDPDPALVRTLPRGQELVAAFRQLPAEAPGGKPQPASPAGVTVDFAKDIRPLLERSCLECHSGKRPRGGLSMTSRTSLVNGGQSGMGALVPGRSADSLMIHLTQGVVEDMEMPPLSRRTKFPALSAEEINRLAAWIDAGAIWPEDAAPTSAAAKNPSPPEE